MEGVVGFLKRHQKEYDEFIDLVRTGYFGPKKRNPGAPEPGSGVTMAFLADYFVDAERVDMTDETLRKELHIPDKADDDDYQEILEVHSQAWIDERESLFDLMKPLMEREREKELDFFLVIIEICEYPGNIIWSLFNNFINIDSDHDFCLLLILYY